MTDDSASSPTRADSKTGGAQGKGPSAHPPVATMVDNAIVALKNRKGSSLAAIKKYIEANNEVSDIAKVAPFIKRYLKSGVTSGKLIQTKGTGASGSFKLAKVEKLKEAKKTKATKKPKEDKKPTVKKPATPTERKTIQAKTKSKVKTTTEKSTKVPKKVNTKVKDTKTPKKSSVPKGPSAMKTPKPNPAKSKLKSIKPKTPKPKESKTGKSKTATAAKPAAKKATVKSSKK